MFLSFYFLVKLLCYSEVEKHCNSMTAASDIYMLGPSGFISQDSVMDKTATYRNISLAYQVC